MTTAGASYVIVIVGSPFDLTALESLPAQRDAINASRNADHRRSSFDDDGERGILLRRLLLPLPGIGFGKELLRSPCAAPDLGLRPYNKEAQGDP